jgi:hypothetical protein
MMSTYRMTVSKVANLYRVPAETIERILPQSLKADLAPRPA